MLFCPFFIVISLLISLVSPVLSLSSAMFFFLCFLPTSSLPAVLPTLSLCHVPPYRSRSRFCFNFVSHLSSVILLFFISCLPSTSLLFNLLFILSIAVFCCLFSYIPSSFTVLLLPSPFHLLFLSFPPLFYLNKLYPILYLLPSLSASNSPCSPLCILLTVYYHLRITSHTLQHGSVTVNASSLFYSLI